MSLAQATLDRYLTSSPQLNCTSREAAVPLTTGSFAESPQQPERVEIRGIRAIHINKLIRTAGFIVDKDGGNFLIQDISWVKNIRHLDAPLRVGLRWREPVPIKHMAAAPHPLKCVCGHGCADVSLGDYVIVTGILLVEPGDPDPLFRDVSTLGQVGYVFSKFLEVSHVPEVMSWEKWWESLSPRSRSYRMRESQLILDTIRRLGLSEVSESSLPPMIHCTFDRVLPMPKPKAKHCPKVMRAPTQISGSNGEFEGE